MVSKLLNIKLMFKAIGGLFLPAVFFFLGIYNLFSPTNATGVFAWIFLVGISFIAAPALHLVVFEDEIRAAVGPIVSRLRVFLNKRRAVYFGSDFERSRA